LPRGGVVESDRQVALADVISDVRRIVRQRGDSRRIEFGAVRAQVVGGREHVGAWRQRGRVCHLLDRQRLQGLAIRGERLRAAGGRDLESAVSRDVQHVLLERPVGADRGGEVKDSRLRRGLPAARRSGHEQSDDQKGQRAQSGAPSRHRRMQPSGAICMYMHTLMFYLIMSQHRSQ